MNPDLRSSKDFLAGLLFLTIGTAAIVVAREYPFGTAMRMGSGYFPTVLGGILVLFGLFLAARGVRSSETAPIEWGWWPLACIVAAMVLFGFFLPRLGLVPALAAMFFAAAAGGREFRLLEVLVLTAVMTAFAVAVFVYVLKLPFQLFPRGLLAVIENLALGFGVAFSLQNLAYCFAGVALGTLIGVLPGISPLVAIGMLFPLTFTLPPVASLIMLAGIYYGAQYGGSTTSILVNLPGETASAVTCLDGYQMARQGRAGPALAIAALASFFAGCVGTMLIALVGPPLGEWALAFGPWEYCALMLMGLVGSAVLAQGDAVKGLAMVALGLLLGIVGTDVNSGMVRYAFGVPELMDGIGFTVIAVGLFAVAEIVMNLESREPRHVFTDRVPRLMPSREDLKSSSWPAVRGTAVGAFFGVLPGTGPALSSFAAYMLEKKLARDPSRFGKGAIEGVAAPEAANNAAAQTGFIPTLTLGIPGTPVMALMVGAMIMQGLAPGPQVIAEKPELFWGIVASMWIGNLMLVVLNLPLVGLWVRLLRVPYRWLFPSVVMFCAIGNYSVSNNPVDVYLCAGIGVLGYVLAKLECEPAPLLLGYVLGPLLEEHLRRAFLLARGDPTPFFTRPISLAFMIGTALVLAVMVAPALRGKKAA